MTLTVSTMVIMITDKIQWEVTTLMAYDAHINTSCVVAYYCWSFSYTPYNKAVPPTFRLKKLLYNFWHLQWERFKGPSHLWYAHQIPGDIRIKCNRLSYVVSECRGQSDSTLYWRGFLTYNKCVSDI